MKFASNADCYSDWRQQSCHCSLIRKTLHWVIEMDAVHIKGRRTSLRRAMCKQAAVGIINAGFFGGPDA